MFLITGILGTAALGIGTAVAKKRFTPAGGFPPSDPRVVQAAAEAAAAVADKAKVAADVAVKNVVAQAPPEQKEAVQAVAEEAAEEATSSMAAKVILTGVAVAATVALLKGLSERRAREDLAYARKQWVKDILAAIAQLKPVELTGKSDIDVFRFILTYHPPLYPGPPVEAAAKNITGGGTAYLEHTGWSPVQTLYRVREKLGVEHPKGSMLDKWVSVKETPPPVRKPWGRLTDSMRRMMAKAQMWPFSAAKWAI